MKSTVIEIGNRPQNATITFHDQGNHDEALIHYAKNIRTGLVHQYGFIEAIPKSVKNDLLEEEIKKIMTNELVDLVKYRWHEFTAMVDIEVKGFQFDFYVIMHDNADFKLIDDNVEDASMAFTEHRKTFDRELECFNWKTLNRDYENLSINFDGNIAFFYKCYKEIDRLKVFSKVIGM